jgi:WD40-like Beta Propeller Repeat
VCRAGSAYLAPPPRLSCPRYVTSGAGCSSSPCPVGKGRDMTRMQTFYLPALIVAAAVLMACAALLAVSEKAQASFPGENGRIAYVAFGGTNSGIYTINPYGSGKTKVTNSNRGEDEPAYSPNGKRIAYAGYDETDYEIYTFNVGGGGGRLQVTDTAHYARDPSWESGP